jgi:hypothetical protein
MLYDLKFRLSALSCFFGVNIMCCVYCVPMNVAGHAGTKGESQSLKARSSRGGAVIKLHFVNTAHQ